jgi:hypothetical protein
MITYEWQFLSCEVIQNYNGLENVVKKIDWKLIATDGINSVSADGYSELGNPSVHTYITFDQLTKDIVANWVMSGWNDIETVKSHLEAQLVEMSKPQTVRMNFIFT